MAKSKYDPETFPALAEGYARMGMIDKEIAARLGVSEDSFYEYLKRHSEFSESVKRGKRPVDFAVENALLRLTLGGVRIEITCDRCGAASRTGGATRREPEKETKFPHVQPKAGRPRRRQRRTPKV